MRICDAHCHFFSSRFLESADLGTAGLCGGGPLPCSIAPLGWDDPGTAGGAGRSLGRPSSTSTHVARAALIASIPGDEASVAAAVRRHPSRFVGFFMFNPLAGDVASRLARALEERQPARHLPLPGDARLPARRRSGGGGVRGGGGTRRAVFVHCGVLTVGVRKKLGLPSPFDLRLGDPLALAAVASRFPDVPGDRAALRRRHFPRSADGRRPVRQHPSRHLQLEQLDEVLSRPDARGRLPSRRSLSPARTAAVRHRLVVFPARLAAAGLRCPGRGASTRSASQPSGSARDPRRQLRAAVSSRDGAELQRRSARSLMIRLIVIVAARADLCALPAARRRRRTLHRQASPPTLVLTNGRIVTVDEALPEAQAVAVARRSHRGARQRGRHPAHTSGRRRGDRLQGQLVMPGFIEGHGHFTGVGEAQLS